VSTIIGNLSDYLIVIIVVDTLACGLEFPDSSPILDTHNYLKQKCIQLCSGLLSLSFFSSKMNLVSASASCAICSPVLGGKQHCVIPHI
jgi:hypothetical protein